MTQAVSITSSQARRAFTLVELLIALAIMAIALGIAVPSLRPNARARLISAAELIASDLEYAQSLSIASPDDFAMMRFQTSVKGVVQPTYWLAYESDPDTPINRLYTDKPHLVTFGEGSAAPLEGVAVTLEEVDDRVMFDEFGRVAPAAQARVRLSNDGGSIDVIVSASTGFITIE